MISEFSYGTTFEASPTTRLRAGDSTSPMVCIRRVGKKGSKQSMVQDTTCKVYVLCNRPRVRYALVRSEKADQTEATWKG